MAWTQMVAVIAVLLTNHMALGKLADGKLAAKLDEYHVSVKCMANIMEHYLPGKFLPSGCVFHC